MPSVIETARWAAAQRARESERPDHLFSDPLARNLAGEDGMLALKMSEQYNPTHQDTANYITIRIRFFDDMVQKWAAEGVRQIVLLAAGMDARAYRLSWPGGTTFYEVDHPELLAAKEEILEGQAAKCRRVTLGTDLQHDWAHLLIDAGFDPHQSSVWIIEGLFYYLHEPAVNHVLAEISKLASPGSGLVTDLVSRSLLTSPSMEGFLKAMEERGMGWYFGTDDPVGLFAGHGWRAEISQPDKEGTKYDRQRFPAAVQAGNSSSFFVVARKD